MFKTALITATKHCLNATQREPTIDREVPRDVDPVSSDATPDNVFTKSMCATETVIARMAPTKRPRCADRCRKNAISINKCLKRNLR